jgi:hypothetical protein
MPPCSRAELIRKLEALDFSGPFPGGKHVYMTRASARVTIPNPHGGTLDGAFVRLLINQAGIDPKDWLNA